MHEWTARLAAVALALLPAAGALADPAARCAPPEAGTAAVRAATDGRTLALADGRTVRLAGIEVARGIDAAARAALERFSGGRTLSLHRLGPATDRYGRVAALVRVAGDPGGPSAQVALLSQGLARVAAPVGDRDCAAQFLSAERAARAAGLGLWSDPYYLVRRAEEPQEILAQRGRFTLVEGQVLSVRPSGGTIYVNFGRRWSEDFTVTVLKRNERRFSAAGQVLSRLAGRRVRVRGTVEERGGPWIEAMHPEQIEIAGRD